MAEPPKVGSTRVSSTEGAAQVNQDGSISQVGTTGYEQIYLGKRAAKQRGFGEAGWYDRTPRNTEAANRTARVYTNNEVRSGQVGYGSNENREPRFKGRPERGTYGSKMSTASARAVSNNRLRRKTTR